MQSIIVHPAYLTRMDIHQVFPVRNNKTHGNYADYLKNICNYYANNNAILIVDAPSGKLHSYLDNFQPNNLVFE